MKQEILLSRLLDKYEKSKHLTQPGVSNRRVMLQIGKKKNEFPEYDYEDAQCRDAWNQAVIDLETQGLVSAQWVSGRPVLACVSLNLNCLPECYQRTGRIHPEELARVVAQRIQSRLVNVTTDWVLAWEHHICRQAEENLKVPSYCKEGPLLDQLLTAFSVYDALRGGTITMRAFSGKCYQDTKTFEREVKDQFLRIASEYASGLAEACEQEKMGDRERLAYLGIYARPELYELSGNCVIRTAQGEIDMSAAVPFGLALPSTGVDSIHSFDMKDIQTVVFIENKTNYDEYILSEQRADELVVYHGGFMSPQKQRLFEKIAASIQNQTQVVFWADIDLGGFRMFERLQAIFPALSPMRMSGEDVEAHHLTGLKRPEHYLHDVQTALDCGKYPLFCAAMRKILEYGVTIEQESFLVD